MILEDSYISFVNLDSRKDRLVRMENTLATAGLHAVRTRGMLPEEYQDSPDRIRCMLRRPQKGAIGCHFSQVKIMQTALQLNRHAFVMEDDLVICSDFQKRMAWIEAWSWSNQWDVLWMGATFHVNPPWWHKDDLGRDAETTDVPNMMRTYGAFSTHAYIVHRDSIEKILSMIEDVLPESMGIDWAFIQIQPKLRTFSFVPGMMIQYDNQSNIGKGMTMFSNFKKLGPYWFQNLMTDFDPKTFNWHECQR